MTTGNSAVYQRFIESLVLERHASSATREAYGRELACFLSFLENYGLDYSSVSTEDIKSYLISRAEEKKLSSRTTARSLTVLRLFFSFAVSDGVRDDDPTQFLPSNKIHVMLPETVPPSDMQKILDSIDTSTPEGFRDRTMFELIYSCGLRVSECINLRISDYHRLERRITVTGKGDKMRNLPVGDVAMKFLNEYLTSIRYQLCRNKSCSYIFVSERGAGITRQQVWNRLNNYCSTLNIHVKVHSLRHSFATDLIKGGADLRSVQELLGHSDIRTTEIYTHLNTDDLKKAFDMFHPDGNKGFSQ